MARSRGDIVGFYTDEKKRVRPITRPKRRRIVRIRTQPAIRRRVVEILKRQLKAMGLGDLSLKVEFNPWKRTPAHVHLRVNRRTGRIEKLRVVFNPKTIEKLYEADPERAERALRFMVAHELAHVEQAVKMGRYLPPPTTAFGLRSWMAERAADRRAEQLTGVSRSEFESFVKEVLEPPERKAPTKMEDYTEGRPRVLGWISGHGSYKGELIIPRRSIQSIDDIPKSALRVFLVVYEDGKPKVVKVSREEAARFFR